jgi:hypothetical protein
MTSLWRSAVLMALVAGAGCASSSSDMGTRATNPTPPTAQGIGPSADQGAASRDMPGGGRGSMTTTKGK